MSALDGSTVRDVFDGSFTAPVLDDVKAWFERFIGVTDDLDLDLLTLWAAHTHVVMETYTTPRLNIDSAMFGSGKTTLCEQLAAVVFTSRFRPRRLVPRPCLCGWCQRNRERC